MKHYSDEIRQPIHVFSSGVVHDVTDYGAKGDGTTDDTSAFQAAIDSLPKKGGVVVVPFGNFRIDPVTSVRLRSHMSLQMQFGAVLHAIANDEPRYNVLLAEDVENVTITGGSIVGDKEMHVFRTFENAPKDNTHEWGHGIRVRRANLVSVVNVDVGGCTGDGLSVNGSEIYLENVRSRFNRRQALTIGQTNGVTVFNCVLSDTGAPGEPGILWAKPGSGIDIEPDAGWAENILIRGCVVKDNRGTGLQSMTVEKTDPAKQARIRNVRIYDNNISRNGGYGLLTIRSSNVDVMANVISDNDLHGLRVATDSDVYVADNEFFGNYKYVREGQKSFFGYSEDFRRDISLAGGLANIGRNYYGKPAQ